MTVKENKAGDLATLSCDAAEGCGTRIGESNHGRSFDEVTAVVRDRAAREFSWIYRDGRDLCSPHVDKADP